MTYGQRERAAVRKMERVLQKGRDALAAKLAAMTPVEHAEYENKMERLKSALRRKQQ